MASAEHPTDEPLAGHERYVKVKDLNRGAFGFVQLAKDLVTGEELAIKFIERGEKVTKYVENEILNLRRLNHFHIVQFRRVFLTRKYFAIVMEYVAQGNMYEYVKQLGHGLTEDEARWYFQQLIVAVDYCHRLGIVNRDIKLENTLLCENPNPTKLKLLKLCDFGYSKDETRQSVANSKVGTLDYYAPEVLVLTQGQSYDAKKADVWACGVMLYAMLTRSYPFRRLEDESLNDYSKLNTIMQRIVAADYSIPERLSPDGADLLAGLLQADPMKRCSIEKILTHPWFVVGLPRGVAEMNENPELYKKDLNRPGVQSVEDIKRLIREAAVGDDGVSSVDPHESWERSSVGGGIGDTGVERQISRPVSRAGSATMDGESPREAMAHEYLVRLLSQVSQVAYNASAMQIAISDCLMPAHRGRRDNAVQIQELHHRSTTMRNQMAQVENIVRRLYYDKGM